MHTSSKLDFNRWLDQKVLGPHLSERLAHFGVEPDTSDCFVHRAPPKCDPPASDGSKAGVPVCLKAIGPAGYVQGFRERRTLQASFQIVRIEGLQTLDKGPCTVTFHRAVEDRFDGRPALRVRVFTHSFGGRMGRVGEFSEVRQLYFSPSDYSLLGWDLGEQRVRLHESPALRSTWVANRSYALGARTVYHRDGHPIESFIERGEVSVHPQQGCSLTLRSYAVDDASEQSTVLELFEFAIEPGKHPGENRFRTHSHNICAVRENLQLGTVLQMTMIRCG